MRNGLFKLTITVVGVAISLSAVGQVNSLPGLVTSQVMGRESNALSQRLKDFKKTDMQMAAQGGIHGGGGDASEIGVNLIRDDILQWINNGGASTFKSFPQGISEDFYVEKMLQYLQPLYVVIGFVSTSQENATEDPEMRVYVNGQPKQCRGFISHKDGRPHILCNLERYPKGGADQYRLIHHEYAGLALVERNDGASSDYELSGQITDFLVPELVYRLAIQSAGANSNSPAPNICDADKFVYRRDPGIVMCDLSGTEGDDNFLVRIPEKDGSCARTHLKSIKGIYLNIRTTVVDSGRTVNQTLQLVSAGSNKILYSVGINESTHSASFGMNFGNGKYLSGVCRP